MSILTPFQGLGELGKEAAAYMVDPADDNFHALYQEISKGSLARASQFMYGICIPKPPSSIILRHTITALFYDRRFTEALYFCHRYSKEYGQNKDMTVIQIWSRIELGLLHNEEYFIQQCQKAKVENYRILNIMLGLALRFGNKDRAHQIAIELYFEPRVEISAFYNMIEAGLRVSDFDLVVSAIQRGRLANIQLIFGRRTEAQILRILRRHFCRLLYAFSTGSGINA